MATLNFPDAPSTGDTYTDSNSGFTYEWNGTVWISTDPSTVSNIREMDDISSSFNGSTTAFTVQVSGINVEPANVQQLIISVGGVMQNAGQDFTLSGSTLTFTTAPTSGLTFFGVILGTALSLNTVADGSVGTSSFEQPLTIGDANDSLTIPGNAVVSGILTAGNAYVSGILTAKTLNYDNVTDIYSTGIITAKGGIQQTGNEGLHVSAGITTVGIFTATKAVIGLGVTINNTGIDAGGGIVTAFKAELGIGVTVNNTGLHVSGIGTFAGALNANNSIKVMSAENTLGILSSTDDGANLDFYDDDTHNRIRTVDGQLQLRADVDNNVGNSKIRMFVDGATVRLVVNPGGIEVSGIATADGFSVGNGEFFKGINNSGDSKIVGGYISGSNTLRLGESLYLDSSSKLGISSSVPEYTLDMIGDQMRFRSSSSGSNAVLRLWGQDANTGGAIIAQNATGAAAPLHFYYSNTDLGMTLDSSGDIGIGEDDPDGNKLLIREASTVGTTKGHIMLTGDSATNGEGPQIVFSESGSGSQMAGAYIGHAREGSNSMGTLVFGTRGTAGDANTVPTERLKITSTGAFQFSNGLFDEKVNITAGKLSDNTNIDLENGMVHYFSTQESTTSTPNIRVNSSVSLQDAMDTGDVCTVTLITTAAAAGYSANLTIDGNAVTEEWVGGAAPAAGGADGLDIYTYTIICIGTGTGDSGFKVIGNLTNATN